MSEIYCVKSLCFTHVKHSLVYLLPQAAISEYFLRLNESAN